MCVYSERFGALAGLANAYATPAWLLRAGHGLRCALLLRVLNSMIFSVLEFTVVEKSLQ
jgi:hypothetical protein